MGRRKGLTPEQVLQIRTDTTYTLKKYAQLFNVSYLTILKAKRGQGAYTNATIQT